jgi:hypothetical protein
MSLVPAQNQMILVPNLPIYFFMTHFNITLRSTPIHRSCLLPSDLPTTKLYAFLMSPRLLMPRPPLSNACSYHDHIISHTLAHAIPIWSLPGVFMPCPSHLYHACSCHAHLFPKHAHAITISSLPRVFMSCPSHLSHACSCHAHLISPRVFMSFPSYLSHACSCHAHLIHLRLISRIIFDEDKNRTYEAPHYANFPAFCHFLLSSSIIHKDISNYHAQRHKKLCC